MVSFSLSQVRQHPGGISLNLELAALLLERFRGNPSTVAVEKPGEHPQPFQLPRPMTPGEFAERHLGGTAAIGVYVINPSNQSCDCSALDFDDHGGDGEQSVADARTVYQFLVDNSLSPVLEISQSGTGAHVWLFHQQPILAETIRAFWKAVLRQCECRSEIYPRQDRLTEDKPLGNFIRIPLWNESRFESVTGDVLDPVETLKEVRPVTPYAIQSRIEAWYAPDHSNLAVMEFDTEGLPERVKHLLNLDPESLLSRRWLSDTDGMMDATRSGIVQAIATELVRRFVPTPEIEAALRWWCKQQAYDKDERWLHQTILKAYSFVQSLKSKESIRVSTFAGMVHRVADQLDDGVIVPTGIASLDGSISGVGLGELAYLAARPGSGKCLGKGTPVLMYDGTVKPVEDVVAGEQVMGPDSKPRTVLGTTSGNAEMYKVQPVKGDSFLVNRSHVLSLKMSTAAGGYKKGEIVNLSVSEYLTKSDKFKAKAKLWRVGCELPDVPVPVDPYLLGLWLGNGSRANCQMVILHDEVVQEIHRIADTNKIECRYRGHKGKAGCYNIARGPGTKRGRGCNPFLNGLKSLRLNRCDEKFVPDVYLRNSRTVRLEILAGLMDTDGYHDGRGCFFFTMKDKKLSDGIVYLARSLGLAAYIKPVKCTCTNNGKVGDYWFISISGDTSIVPCRVSYKKAPKRRQIKDTQVTGVTVTAAGFGEYYGFELDGDHLFLLGDFTVSHNSSFMLEWLDSASAAGFPGLFLSLEMSQRPIGRRVLLRMGYDTETVKMMNKAEIHKAIDRHYEDRAPLYFLEDTYSLDDIKRTIEDYVANKGVKIVGIDHQGCIQTGIHSEYESISRATMDLASLKKELDISIVVLAHLNREYDNDRGRPKMRHLRGSGALENYADLILGGRWLHQEDPSIEANKTRYLFHVLKCRNREAKVADVEAKFLGPQQKFL